MEGYEEAEAEASSILEAMEKEELRNMILKNKRRIDGRGPEDIRGIWTETGYFPRAHGSAIFRRGDTQALVSVTRGTKRDAQSIDSLFQHEDKTYVLHYSFRPFSGGEAGFMRAQGMREVAQ